MAEFRKKNRAEKLNIQIKYDKKEEIYLIIDKKDDEIVGEIDYTMFNKNIFKKIYYLRFIGDNCFSQKDLKHIQKKIDFLNKK